MVFNPKLEKRPLVVLSNNDGCIIARSKKAKELGIKMGEPAFLYKERKDIVMLSSNFTLYADMSNRVMEILSTFSPDMEVYSIDEAFLKVETIDCAVAMREKIKKWTGIPISVGVAPTKTLAKLANKRAKKGNGVFVLNEQNRVDELEKTELEEIWGIGAGLNERLKRKGIYTAAQFCDVPDERIRKWLGISGLRIALELRGTCSFDLIEVEEKKKSILCSRSFGKKIIEFSLLQEAVATFASNAAKKLREQGSFTKFLSVFISNGLNYKSCHIQIPNATNYTPDLIAMAKEGLARIYQPEMTYKKAGVLLADFTEDGQMDFISPENNLAKKKIAMQIMDKINIQYDKQAVRFAAEGVNDSWKSKRNACTPQYTTRWSDLLKVLAD